MTCGYITEFRDFTEFSGHRWTIEKYSSYYNMQAGDFLISPSFVTDGQFQWHLQLYPNGRNSESSHYVSIRLFFDNYSDNGVSAKCEFAILDQKGCLGNHKRSNTSYLYDLKKNNWAFNKFLLIDDIRTYELLDNDSLTLHCRITVDIPFQESTSCISKPFNKFHSFLENEEFSDLTIVVSGVSFKTHKIILASESPVFYAMFKHDMSEKQNNTVEISDIDAKIFRQALNFIYKGDVENADISKELLAIAERYQFERLKDRCEKYFCSNITMENAIEYLAIADLYNVDKLKADVNNFIINNAEKIVQTEEFKKMNKLQPYLLTELFHKLVNVRIVKSDTISSNSSSKS